MSEIKRLTFSLKEDMYLKIRIKAAKENVTMSEWICLMLKKELEKAQS